MVYQHVVVEYGIAERTAVAQYRHDRAKQFSRRFWDCSPLGHVLLPRVLLANFWRKVYRRGAPTTAWRYRIEVTAPGGSGGYTAESEQAQID